MKRMEIREWHIKGFFLITLLLFAQFGRSTDVKTADELRSAVNRGDTYIKLLSNIELGDNQTLTISSGDLTLDLNGKTLSSTRTSDGSATCVNVNGGNVVITGGGTISATAKGTTDGFWGSGKDGYNAIALSYDRGNVSVLNATFVASPTKGAGVIAGKNGTGYTLDPNNGTTVADMVPYGAYMTNSTDYGSEGLIASSTTVALSRYTAEYNYNSGTEIKKGTTSYTLEDTFTYPEVFREGHTFGSWQSDSETATVKGVPVLKNRAATGTIRFTADWTPIPYTIQYTMNGGVNNADNPLSYDITKGNVSLKDPQPRVGYTFSGWSDEKGQPVTSLVYEQIKNAIDQTYTLTARWKRIDYTVIFTVETSEGKSLTYTVETKDTLLPDPLLSEIPVGREFKGWQTSDGTPITSLPIAQPSNLTLSPIWGDITYYVSFCDEKGANLFDPVPYYAKDGLPAARFPSVSKEGFIFEGWFKKEDTQHTRPIASLPVGTSGNTELYAYFTEIRYTLTYELKGASYTGANPVSYTFTKKATLPTDKDLSYPGYAFKGWFLRPDFSGAALTEVPVSGGNSSDGGRKESFTAYALWEMVDYTIVFKTDGGTPVDNATYNIEEGVATDKMPKTAKAGYTFLGWYIGDKKVTKIEPGHGNLELTARWKLIPYSITYHLNGGTNPAGAVASYTYEQTVALPRPTRENYTFDNWYKEADFSGEPVSEIPNHSTGDKVFYARWTAKEYTISFETNGGSELADQKYVYGEETNFARKTKKQNYTFVGWYRDKALTQFFGEKIPATASGDMTLFAKWTLAQYAIDYDCYYGTNPSGAPAVYTVDDEVILPTPQRENFTFAGWYDNDRLKGEKQTKIAKGSSGDKKFYATWTRANAVYFVQPKNGRLTVVSGGKELKSGDRVGAGVSLTVTATATDPAYKLGNLTIAGTSYNSSPQTIRMPSEDGVAISATFTESGSTTTASAPRIILTPDTYNKYPKGEDVKVRLEKTDPSTVLYYSVDGSAERLYTGEFRVESAQDTLVIQAIARKNGYEDGITTRTIVFDNGKIFITFDLPLGVKATNLTGGEVVSATMTGGTFEFRLDINRHYYTNLDSMVVSANGSAIKANVAGYYSLTNCTEDIQVRVSGLRAHEYTVTLQQTDHGKVYFTDDSEEDSVAKEYGSTLSITAEADEDFKFLEWSTGSQANPLELVVAGDSTISARFISDYKSYAVTLPEIEGVTVKPYSGYSTEVKKDGSFKFYLQIADGYREENVSVCANGKELTKSKGGYALSHINNNVSISVAGIVRDTLKLALPGHVNAKVIENMQETSRQNLYEETMILLHATAPEGQVFTKWNDGKSDNPRISTARDALQLFPFFDDKEEGEERIKVVLEQSAGAAITAVNANADAVKKGDLQLKVVVLPGYSHSDVVLTAGDEPLKPQTTLRSSADRRTYLYTLPVLKEGLTVRLSGLTLNTYHLTVSPTNGGTVSIAPSVKVTHGQKVQLKAEPESGKLFVKWWDGNTLNPYPYTVTGQTEVKAFFVGTASPVSNASIGNTESHRITVSAGTLCIDLPEESDLFIWNYKGMPVHTRRLSAGSYRYPLPAGAYLVKVGKETPVKVIVR